MRDMITAIDDIPSPTRPNGIWWLASYPKSGSTWVRMFLNAAVTRFPANINAAFQYCCGDLLGGYYQTASAIPLTKMGVTEALYCRPAVLLNFLALNQSRDACLKTHHANIYVDDMPLCPAKVSLGAVYIVRDPRDVVVSFAQHMGLKIDTAIEMMRRPRACIHRSGSALFHYLSTWSTHVRSWLSHDNPIPTSMVRYEDLHMDPPRSFRHVLDALGLSAHVDDDALSYGMNQSSFDRLRTQEESQGFRERGGKQETFFNEGRIGRWVGILSASQVSEVERDHGDVMQELGYALCGDTRGTQHQCVESYC